VPVLTPGLGKDVRANGIFVVGFDNSGDVVCIRFISGYPLFVAPVMDSVKQWKNQKSPGFLRNFGLSTAFTATTPFTITASIASTLVTEYDSAKQYLSCKCTVVY
jgi:hypothetical protein